MSVAQPLTPHLSRAVKVAHEPNGAAAKLNRRKDRDLLVADWGLHHLHLSTAIEADGFVEPLITKDIRYMQ